MIEVATIGTKGQSDFPVVCPVVVPNRVFVRFRGGKRVEAALLAKAIHRDGALRNLVLKYYEAFTFQVPSPSLERCHGRRTLLPLAPHVP